MRPEEKPTMKQDETMERPVRGTPRTERPRKPEPSIPETASPESTKAIRPADSDEMPTVQSGEQQPSFDSTPEDKHEDLQLAEPADVPVDEPAAETAGRLQKHRFIALCGAVVALAALFVVFCGVALNPRTAGADGEQGLQGIQGEQGPQGIPGAQGEKGDKGARGEQGIQGIPGKSAYEIYCEQYGYEGSEEEWMREVYDRLSVHTSQEIYVLAEACTVTVESFRETDGLPVKSLSRGSGFFMDSQGLIMTAYHVIDGATSIKVTMPDSAVYEVTGVVAFDKARDLAVIRINTSRETPYLSFETEGVMPGETVYTFGSIGGDSDGAFSSGVVASSLLETPLDGQSGKLSEFRYTCSMPLGNSGAPILNAHGKVIGIVTRGYTEGSTLNTATFIGEASNLDMAYDRAVTDFFTDTEYYRIKWQEQARREMENNNTMKTADVMDQPGQTFSGAVKKDDPDYFSFEITGNGSVDLSLLFSVDTADFYYPILIPSAGSNVELTWERVDYGDQQLYGARATLAPGIYYMAINGHYSDQATSYGLYTYWRPLAERNSFAYEVTFEDALS